LEPAMGLVNFLNQTGTLKRVRADRDIDLEERLTPLARQRRQIERDIVNVRWLGDAAERLGELMDEAIRALGGGPRSTGDLLPDVDAEEEVTGEGGEVRAVAPTKMRIGAMVPVDFERGGLGTTRDLGAPSLAGRHALR